VKLVAKYFIRKKITNSQVCFKDFVEKKKKQKDPGARGNASQVHQLIDMRG
jgi:hypothetical protein